MIGPTQRLSSLRAEIANESRLKEQKGERENSCQKNSRDFLTSKFKSNSQLLKVWPEWTHWGEVGKRRSQLTEEKHHCNDFGRVQINMKSASEDRANDHGADAEVTSNRLDFGGYMTDTVPCLTDLSILSEYRYLCSINTLCWAKDIFFKRF